MTTAVTMLLLQVVMAVDSPVTFEDGSNGATYDTALLESVLYADVNQDKKLCKWKLRFSLKADKIVHSKHDC